MDFNPILDDLPDTFHGCQVNTDFRQGLRFFAALADNELNEQERNAVVLRLFFPITLPDEQDEIWPFIQYFIVGKETNRDEGNKERFFDFNVDSGRLYAAFLQAYGIDLRTEKMHWWLFLELFRDLPDDTMLSKVIDIRSKKPPKYADAEYKSTLNKAKRAFAIEGADNSAASLGNTLRAWAGR